MVAVLKTNSWFLFLLGDNSELLNWDLSFVISETRLEEKVLSVFMSMSLQSFSSTQLFPLTVASLTDNNINIKQCDAYVLYIHRNII